jgi:tRNA(fMet)-specific endonuclease VapC
MRYLIDTDWIASWLNGRQEAHDLLSAFAEDELAISLITYGEIYDGIYFGPNPGRNEAIFQRLLQLVDVLDLNRDILEEFARIRGRLRASGQVIGDFDILIAATALHHDMTLVTRNRRHFERVPDLSLYA